MTGRMPVPLAPTGAAAAPTLLTARWRVGVWASGLVALLLALPIQLPIPGLETLNILGQSVAVASVLLLLPPQLATDVVARRRGSGLRVLIALMVLTGAVSWAVVAGRQGVAAGPFLSLLNWISLGALALCGQVLFGDVRRLDRALDIWVAVHSVLSAAAVVYIVAMFGSEVFLSEARTPFQLAVRDFLPSWPNYFALAIDVAICILYARILAGRGSPLDWVQLVALLAGLLISFSRSGWLVCIASVLVVTTASGRLTRAIPVILAGALFAAVVASQIPGIRYQVAASLKPGTSQSVTLIRRAAFALEAIRIWRRDPWVGIGFARFDQYATLAELSRISAVGARGVETLGSVHNEYLSVLLKGGIISTMGFVVFLIGATRRLTRLARGRVRSDPVRRLAITGIGISAVLLVGGLGAESFRTLSCSALYWIVVGGLSVVPQGAVGPTHERSGR